MPLTALLCAFFLATSVGGRAFTPLAILSWCAATGMLGLQGSWLAFLGHPVTPYILTLLAVAELVADKLPATPSRMIPVQFTTRLLVGALCGAALGIPAGLPIPAAILGAAGAVIGTYSGATTRTTLARLFKKDRPAALLEDAQTILGTLLTFYFYFR